MFLQVILVLKSFDLYANTPLTVTIQIISHTLAYMNSCINPVLYAFLSDNFRKAFRKVSAHTDTPDIVQLLRHWEWGGGGTGVRGKIASNGKNRIAIGGHRVMTLCYHC